MSRRTGPSPIRYFLIAAVLAVLVYAGVTVGRLVLDPSALADRIAEDLDRMNVAEVVTLGGTPSLGWSGGPVVRLDAATVNAPDALAALALTDVVGRLDLGALALGATQLTAVGAQTATLTVAPVVGITDGPIALQNVEAVPDNQGWALFGLVGPDAVEARLTLAPIDDRRLMEAAYVVLNLDGQDARLTLDGTVAQQPSVEATVSIDSANPSDLARAIGLTADWADWLEGAERVAGQFSIAQDLLVVTGGEVSWPDLRATGDLSHRDATLSGRVGLDRAVVSAAAVQAYGDALARLGETALDLSLAIDSVAFAASDHDIGPIGVTLAGTGSSPVIQPDQDGFAGLVLEPERTLRDAQLRISDLSPIGTAGTAWIGLPDAPDGTVNLLLQATSLDLERAAAALLPLLGPVGPHPLFVRVRAEEAVRGSGVIRDLTIAAGFDDTGITAVVDDARIGDGSLALEIGETGGAVAVQLTAESVDGEALAALAGLPAVIDGVITVSAQAAGTIAREPADDAGMTAESGILTISGRDVALVLPAAWRSLDRAATLPERVAADLVRGEGRIDAGRLWVDQLAIVAPDLEIDATGSIDLDTLEMDISLLVTRRSDAGTTRVGGILNGPVGTPRLRVTQR